MKALSLQKFIEAAFDTQKKLIYSTGIKEEPGIWEEDDYVLFQHNLILIEAYSRYLSQPFTHDMIKKLFKKWEIICDVHPEVFSQHINKNKYYLTRKTTTPLEYYLISNTAEYFKDFSLPETLGDFIRDCERVGIELEFKEKNDGK